MTEETQKDITAEDLSLLDPALEDAGKTEEDFWNDLESKEAPANGSAPDADENKEPEAKAEEKPGDAKPADAGKVEEKPDIWGTASPEQRAAFEEAQRRASEAEHRLRSDGGRVSSLQRKINSLQEALKAKPGTDARRNQTATEALGRLKTEYPEIADLLDPVLSSVRGEVTDLSNAEKQRIAVAQRDLNESVNEYATIVTNNARTVEQAHPGYEKFLLDNQQAFLAWVEDQPRAIREAAYANAQHVVDAPSAIDVIQRFKAHITPGAKVDTAQPGTKTETQPLNGKRERQLAASASPQGGGRRPTTTGIPDTDDEQAIWNAMEAQEQARRRA